LQDLDRLPIVTAAVSTGIASVLVFALLPILGGGFADKFLLDDRDVGLVASSYFATYALIALSSGIWIRRANWVIAVNLGYAAMFIGLLVCFFSDSFGLSLVSLALVGVGGGVLFPISLTLVSDMRKTDRNYAIKISAEQLVPAAMLVLLSSTLFVEYDLSTLLLLLLAVLAGCFLLTLSIPPVGNPTKHTLQHGEGGDLFAILSLIALALNFAGFAGIWAFIERIAVDNDFEKRFTSIWLAVGLLTSGFGALAAAAIADRYGRILPILIPSILAVVSLLLLRGSVSEINFAIALSILPLSYYFAISYMYAVVADADHRGNMSGLMAFALAVGAGGGPAIFGYLKSENGPVLLAMGTLCIVGMVLIIVVQLRNQASQNA